MRRRTWARRRPVATSAALALAAASLAGCSGDGEGERATVDLSPTQRTTASAAGFTVTVPAGSASGGTLTVAEDGEPAGPPAGLVPLGPAATVSLGEGGAVEDPMTVSVTPPGSLVAGQVPVLVARTGDGDAWLATRWRAGEPVTAELPAPGAVFLARFDPTAWSGELAAGFAAATVGPARARPPECEAADLPPVTSDEGDDLLFCAGTVPLTTTDGFGTTVEAPTPVLRLTNTRRLAVEVTHPADWSPVEERADAALVAERLGLAPPAAGGLASALLLPRETLTLTLPDEAPRGEVTAVLTPASWTVSSLRIAGRFAVTAVRRVDAARAPAVRRAVAALDAALLAPQEQAAVRAEGPDEEQAALELLRECLAPAAAPDVLSVPAAQALTERALTCLPAYLRERLPEPPPDRAVRARMAEAVAGATLAALPPVLEQADEPWQAVPTGTDEADTRFRVWVGAPPPVDYDYTSAPKVFRPGQPVEVEEWSPAFESYVEERVQFLLDTNDASVPADSGDACPYGAFSVRKYRSHTFALAGQITCGGDVYALVLGRLADGWHEIDDIQGEAFFSCDLMGIYQVPAFIAGDQCLDGTLVEEYGG